MYSSVWVDTVTMVGEGGEGGWGCMLVWFLCTRLSTSTTMGSLAVLNASTASSWVDFDRSCPFTWNIIITLYIHRPTGEFGQVYFKATPCEGETLLKVHMCTYSTLVKMIFISSKLPTCTLCYSGILHHLIIVLKCIYNLHTYTYQLPINLVKKENKYFILESFRCILQIICIVTFTICADR